MRLFLAILCASFLIQANKPAWAQGKVTLLAPSEQRKLMLETSLENSTNLEKRGESEANAQSKIEIVMGRNFLQHFFATLSVSAHQEWNNEQRFQTDDSLFRLNYGTYELNPTFAINADFYSVLPTSKKSRQEDSLVTSLTLRPNLVINLSRNLLKGLVLYFRSSVTRHFHNFTTTLRSDSNSKYSMGQRLDIEYQPFKQWSLLVSGAFVNAWTYGGTMKQNFRAFEEVGYLFHDHFLMNVGHRNEGSRLKADGQSSNVDLFNNRTSIIYTTIKYTF